MRSWSTSIPLEADRDQRQSANIIYFHDLVSLIYALDLSRERSRLLTGSMKLERQERVLPSQVLGNCGFCHRLAELFKGVALQEFKINVNAPGSRRRQRRSRSFGKGLEKTLVQDERRDSKHSEQQQSKQALHLALLH